MWTALAVVFVGFWIALGFYGAFTQFGGVSPLLLYSVGIFVGILIAFISIEIVNHNKRY